MQVNVTVWCYNAGQNSSMIRFYYDGKITKMNSKNDLICVCHYIVAYHTVS